MAIYYDEYGDYSYDAATFDHQDFFYDTDPHYCDTSSDTTPAEYSEPYSTEYAYEEAHLTDSQVYTSHSSDYEAEEEDTGCMETAYGEPGYWEEYHRRRYEILYGADPGDELGSAETPADASEPVCDVVELALHGAAADSPYNEHEYEESAEFHSVEEDEALAWQDMWERGPLVGENELAWAEAMEAWRQRIESDEQSSEESTSEDADPYESASDEEFVLSMTPAHVESLDDVPEPPTLEELQASYDRGDIPESDREECARLLGELWACQLEDERLLAAGYVWDEEMGEYIHPAAMDSPAECDEEEDSGFAYAVVEPILEPVHAVHHVAEAQPIPPLTIPRKISPQRGTFVRHHSFAKSSKPAFPPTHWTKTPKRRVFIPSRSRSLARPTRMSHTKPRRRRPPRAPVSARAASREAPPHLALVDSPLPMDVPAPSPLNVAPMAPASSATPPPVADKSRCSLATVSIIAADVLALKEPVPPDIDATPTASIPPPTKYSAIDAQQFLLLQYRSHPTYPSPPPLDSRI
ncbi:hypothetical protein FB451DRAFT_1465440 [Mycena latifolia]|nr:hypothetical protein FB451DRAFT_1465440 [Mycena latifolia]